MKNPRKILAGLLLALIVPTLPLAQGKLILPQSPEDISNLTKRVDDEPCTRCGVVTDVRSQSRESKQNRASPPPSSGVGSNLVTTPIIGSGTAVSDARDARNPATFYKITVRYDDGTYAFFDQDDKPAAIKGDRIEVVDGRIELRSR